MQFELSEVPGNVYGLTYSNFGGDLLPIECRVFKTKNYQLFANNQITGNVGKSLLESIYLSWNSISTFLSKEIDENYAMAYYPVLHFPRASIPKDGHSAGLALFFSMLGSILNIKISNKIAFSGEITLSGNILQVAGIYEKAIFAFDHGIEKIFVPKANKTSFVNNESDISSKIFFVNHVSEVIELLNLEVVNGFSES